MDVEGVLYNFLSTPSIDLLLSTYCLDLCVPALASLTVRPRFGTSLPGKRGTIASTARACSQSDASRVR